jgi:glucose/mannose-6-phosphate isomerase
MSTWTDSTMLAAVRGIPDHFSPGATAAGEAGRTCRGVRRVIIAGMGGSAFPGDLLRLHTDPLGIDLQVARDYRIHQRVDAQTLVIAASYSGNTEETLSALADAQSRGAQVITLSAGGRLAEVAARDGLPSVVLSKPTPTFQPRAATGFFLGALAAILENAELLPNGVVAMLATGEALRRHTQVEAAAEVLAHHFEARIPVLYTTHPFGVVGRVAKIKLNENAKIPAFFNEIPELNHNEMVGYTRLSGPFTAVMVEDPGAHPRQQHRVATTVATLEANGVPVVRVPLVAGETPLVQALAALYLFDFASCALAARTGVDPNPVAMVEDFKRALGPWGG